MLVSVVEDGKKMSSSENLVAPEKLLEKSYDDPILLV